MDTYGLEHTTPELLNHQIASRVFECLSEDGPLVVILDGAGNSWPSDHEKYSEIFAQSHCLDHIIARIDDGDDPVISDVNGSAVIASQLTITRGQRAYVVISLEGYTQESLVKNIEFVETIVSLMNVIGNLIDKSNQMKQHQNKQHDFVRAGEYVSMN